MDESSADSGLRDRLAEQRTETAFHRTLLAEQRTYSAWIRTGLAAVATGFAIAKFMTGIEPDWLVEVLAAVFVTVGAVMFALAFWGYRHALARLDAIPAGGIPLWIFGLLSLLLLTASIAGLVLMISATVD